MSEVEKQFIIVYGSVKLRPHFVALEEPKELEMIMKILLIIHWKIKRWIYTTMK